MAITVPNCYHTDGTPATVSYVEEIIRPPVAEGAQVPNPAQAARNVTQAIASIPANSNPGVL